MHPTVQASEVEAIGQQLETAAQIERIVEPHLNQGMSVQHRQFGIAPGGPVVVQQQSDAHPPIRSPAQCVEQKDSLSGRRAKYRTARRWTRPLHPRLESARQRHRLSHAGA